VAVIIATIIELVLPENKNKKYVKMVSGIFILFTVISPVTAKFNGNVDLDFEKYNNSLASENIVEVQETASVVTDKNIMKVYKDNLTRNITTGIENLNYVVNSIDIRIDESKNYGAIEEIYLQVDGVQLVSSIAVDKVEVNVSNDEVQREVEKESSLTENDKAIIREFLNNNYRVASSKIHIN